MENNRRPLTLTEGADWEWKQISRTVVSYPTD